MPGSRRAHGRSYAVRFKLRRAVFESSAGKKNCGKRRRAVLGIFTGHAATPIPFRGTQSRYRFTFAVGNRHGGGNEVRHDAYRALRAGAKEVAGLLR